MLRRTIFSAAVLLLLCLLIESNTACKCVSDQSLLQSFADTDLIFIGKAIRISVDQAKLESKIIFQVDNIFKGTLPSEQVTILTNTESTACGLNIMEGEIWQIWAEGSADRFNANSCSRSSKSTYNNIDFLQQQFELDLEDL